MDYNKICAFDKDRFCQGDCTAFRLHKRGDMDNFGTQTSERVTCIRMKDKTIYTE